MEILKTISDMLGFIANKKANGNTIGLVPTMGYLHQGHLSLIKLAKNNSQIVVLSIYVNPMQFAPNEDFEKYPRNLEQDLKFAKAEGCDAVFIPSDKEMYPEKFYTSVNVSSVSQGLCGGSRPTHFCGVTTVVTKLFNIVKPNVAVFGKKDAQQLAVIKKMVRDLNFDIKIIDGDIVRESDGLALSSRNVYLLGTQRSEAIILRSSLLKVKQLFDNGLKNSDELTKILIKEIGKSSVAKIDYVSIVDNEEMTPLTGIINSRALVAVAVFFGRTRLIDNIELI